ncbi:MAG: beta-ketoacyl synthase N-terminal-like domain-containing protein, partial [Rhodomicrobium sp.]
MRRIVITGVGLVTPLGCGADYAWPNLLAGKSGARRVTEFDVSDIPCQIGCFIPRGSEPGEFNPDDCMEPKEQRKVDDFIVYAVSAADQAL